MTSGNEGSLMKSQRHWLKNGFEGMERGVPGWGITITHLSTISFVQEQSTLVEPEYAMTTTRRQWLLWADQYQLRMCGGMVVDGVLRGLIGSLTDGSTYKNHQWECEDLVGRT